MKKYTAAFLLSAAAFSIALQLLFSFYFVKTAALDRFIYIRKTVERNARLSLGAADTFMDFTKSPATAILAIPSCGLNRTVIPGNFDFFVMHADNNTSVFSIYPSALSARKHKSLYVKNIDRLSYNYSGELFGFKCGINNTVYGRSFFIDRSCILLPLRNRGVLTVKKLLYFLLLLVVTNNFLIFIFGVVFSAKAAGYETVQQDNYVLDSALTLAVQAREDSRIMPLLEAEFTLKGRTAGYAVKKLDTNSDYIKVYIKKGNEILFREYLRPDGAKPAVIPRIEAAPVVSPSPTAVTDKILEIPTILPARTPAWTIIK